MAIDQEADVEEVEALAADIVGTLTSKEQGGMEVVQKTIGRRRQSSADG